LLSLVHVLEWRAAVNPEAIALTDQQDAELSYAALAAAAERSAAGFAAAGIAPGDVVPIIARNQAGWVTAMLGLIRAGALPAAVNWRLAAPEVTALLRLAGPAAVVADAGCAALARHLAVADVAVIGIPDERWGETVHAVVVPAFANAAPGAGPAPAIDGPAALDPAALDPAALDPAELVSWARERLAGFKCPTGVTVVSELPRNATGKVLRAALREPFWAGRDRLVS